MPTTKYFDEVISKLPPGLERNAISLRDLTKLAFGTYNSTTERQCREAIEILRRDYHIPVLSHSGKAGRWLAESIQVKRRLDVRARYRRRNHDRILEKRRQYCRENREKVAEYCRSYHLRGGQNGTDYVRQVEAELGIHQPTETCRRCGKKLLPVHKRPLMSYCCRDCYMAMFRRDCVNIGGN